jgi:general stress protein 26
MELDEVKAFATELSAWAHLATVGADHKPDVTPVHPCWQGDTLWVMLGADSVKARNIAANPNVALHWQVSEVGDGVEIWGTAKLYTDVATKKRLWKGVFDYDLNLFAPGGAENSPDTAFLAITPQRAMVVKQYGMRGIERWRA